MRLFFATACFLATILPASALVTATRSGSALATKTYPAAATSIIPVVVTLAAEAGFNITATMDGAPLPMGNTTVSGTGYHEVYETKVNTTTLVSTTTLAFQFIIASPGRGTTEMGLPIMQPYHFVSDAPSAFAGNVLDVIAPPNYPLGMPVPVAVRLKKGAAAGALAGDPLFLTGVVSAGNYPTRSLPLRRGWGSTILPAATVAGSKAFDGSINGLTDSAPINYEATTVWTVKTGNLTGAEVWAANSRIDMTANVVVKAGATLTVGAGTVIRAAAGAEIWVEPGATVNFNGTLSAPIVVAPVSTASPWGGVWLQQSASTTTIASFTATGTLFCCWGANQAWYAAAVTPVRTIFSRHRQMEPCFGIGTNAVCSLTDCSIIGPITAGETRGAGFATKDGSLLLNRTSLQRAITGGEQEGGSVEIHSCAILELNEPGTSPDDGTAFDDQDNDGIYTVPTTGHTYHFTKTVIGWTKDDGIDCGGSGLGTVVCTGCWFESCIHEAFSNSGTGRVPETHDGVHYNNGQGMECGYEGPLSVVDHCLIVGNQCGVRYGDNYNTFATYGGTITVNNSFVLYNEFRDAWAMEFGTATNKWLYQDAKIILKGSKITRADDLAHQNGAEDTPSNSLWNPATDGAQIAGFMPVAGSNVGVAILHDHYSDPISLYPSTNTFTVRLSSFSSQVVTVPWKVTGKVNRNLPAESTIASGTLTFQPGETVKTITAPLPGSPSFDIVRATVTNPTNAEVTGQDAWFVYSATLPTQVVLNKTSTGWDYYANRTPAAGLQKPGNDASGRAWTAINYTEDAIWKTNKLAPIGWGNLGAVTTPTTYLTLGTTLSTTVAPIESGITTYFRKTFTVTDPTAVRSLSLEVLNDDGCVVFINGVAMPPINVDPGTAVGGVAGITSDKLATSTKGDGAAEKVYDVLTADSSVLSALVAGTNVIAIEVHQGSATSSDMVCDAGITLTLNPPGSGAFSMFSMNGASYIIWDDPAYILEESADLSGWSPKLSPPNPFPITVDSPRKFFRVRK